MTGVTISGTVDINYYFAPSDTLLSFGLGGVTVQAIEAGSGIVTAVAETNHDAQNLGYYELIVPIGWSGTVSPDLSTFSFWNQVDPNLREYDTISSDVGDQDFVLSHIQNTSWTEDGLGVVTTTGDQVGPNAVVDGDGGVVIAWMDKRTDSNGDIYAQRIYRDGDTFWTSGGLPVCEASDVQTAPVVASNGYHGALVCWTDKRDGTDYDIYMRNINAWGDMTPADGQWLVCGAEGNQLFPDMTTDAAGQPTIVWEDYRAPLSDIYAVVQGLDNQISICTAAGAQMTPRITHSDPGEVVTSAIITWRDTRSDVSDIYAQLVDFRTHDVGWTTDGVPVCTAPYLQVSPEIIRDGEGGAFVAWMDYRSGTHWDVYAQRLTATGAKHQDWPSNGLLIRENITDQTLTSSAMLAPDGAGGAIIVWADRRSGTDLDIYAQRVTGDGQFAWAASGIAICEENGDQNYPRIAATGAGTFVVTWTDERSGGSEDVYAQRIDTAGNPFWQAGGTPIADGSGSQLDAQVVADISSKTGAFIVWTDDQSGDVDIHATRTRSPLTISGAVTDRYGVGIEGVVLEAVEFNDLNSRNVVTTSTTDEYGDYTLTVEEDWEGFVLPNPMENYNHFEPESPRYYQLEMDVMAQDYVASHVPSILFSNWKINGTAVCQAVADQLGPRLCSDGDDGAITVWEDHRGASPDIFARKVDKDGNLYWQEDGVLVCGDESTQSDPDIVTDGADGAIIVWVDERGSSNDIYAQQIDADGASSWTTDGIVLCDAIGDQYAPRALSDGEGGAYVAWVDERGADKDIFALRIDGSGSIVQGWAEDGVAACTASGDQEEIALALSSDGGLIIVWEDFRNGNWDIFAQLIDADGTIHQGWDPQGAMACDEGSTQLHPAAVSDNQGGAIIVWQDDRNDGIGYSWDILAMRLESNGTRNLYWRYRDTQNGVEICKYTHAQTEPKLIPDGFGGAIITWVDARGDIVAERVDEIGLLQWNPWAKIGRTIYDGGTAPNSDVQLISDQLGGAILTWIDGRNGTADIYTQRIDDDGQIYWREDAVPVTTAFGAQIALQTIPSGPGGVLTVWKDNRQLDFDIYAQRINDEIDLSPTVSFGIPPLSDFMVACPGGDIDAFTVYIDFHSTNLLTPIPKEDIELTVPSGDISFFFNGNPIIADSDVTPDDLSTQITHLWIGGCGTESATVTVQGEPVAVREFNLKSPDMNADGYVDVLDFSALSETYFKCTGDSAYNDCGNFNGDDCINLLDFTFFAFHYGHYVENPTPFPTDSPQWPQSTTGITLAVQRHSGDAEKDRVEVTLIAEDVVDLVTAVVGISTHEGKLKYRRWIPNTNSQLKSVVAPIKADDKTFDLLGFYSTLPVNADRVELGKLEFEYLADNNESISEDDITLLLGDMLTGAGQRMQFKNITVEVSEPAVRYRDHLSQNFPNPFNPTTTIEYSIGSPGHVELAIYNVRGQLVRKLVDEQQLPNRYRKVWDGKSQSGNPVASGAYFYRLKTDRYVSTKKMVFVK